MRQEQEDGLFLTAFVVVFLASIAWGLGMWWWTGDILDAWPLLIALSVALVFGFAA